MSDNFSVEDVARYWDGNAAAWAEQVRRGADVAREWLNNPAFLAFIGDLHGRRVLDAGCGEGYNTRILARRGARMTGVDLSERMIALAQEEERRAPLGIEYARTSYTDLASFADRSFDAVVSFMALMDGPRFDLGRAVALHRRAPGDGRVRRAPIRPHAVGVRQHAHHRRLRARADRGAPAVRGILPGAPEPARLAGPRRAVPLLPRGEAPHRERVKADSR
jgi:SAM-dependent methyltransferase